MGHVRLIWICGVVWWNGHVGICGISGDLWISIATWDGGVGTGSISILVAAGGISILTAAGGGSIPVAARRSSVETAAGGVILDTGRGNGEAFYRIFSGRGTRARSRRTCAGIARTGPQGYRAKQS